MAEDKTSDLEWYQKYESEAVAAGHAAGYAACKADVLAWLRGYASEPEPGDRESLAALGFAECIECDEHVGKAKEGGDNG